MAEGETPGNRRARRINAFLDRVHATVAPSVILGQAVRPQLGQRALAALFNVTPQAWQGTMQRLVDAWRRERVAFVAEWTDLTLARPIMSSTFGSFVADGVRTVFKP